MSFPPLNSEQAEQQARALAVLADAIHGAGGVLPFDTYMELALYAPGTGYYVNGAQKFGRGGDFVTAPELSPLFGQCLAQQCAEVLSREGGDILEFGAGSGALAADILLRLQALDCLPGRYQILELSAELARRQRQTLVQRAPQLLDRVEWLQRLPQPGWRGVILGNEVLDAMPVSRFRRTGTGWQASYVRLDDAGQLVETWRAAPRRLVEAVLAIEARLGPFAPGYTSEINLRLPAWMEAVAGFLAQGVLLLIDYGYPERAYYHPARDMGTLVCHYRQRAHGDFLALPGLQDITAHVDFSAVAEAGVAAGLELAGYTSQAQFLIGCGLDELLSGLPSDGAALGALAAAKQLVLPGAMGERFQAIAFQRGRRGPLRGFATRDMRASL